MIHVVLWNSCSFIFLLFYCMNILQVVNWSYFWWAFGMLWQRCYEQFYSYLFCAHVTLTILYLGGWVRQSCASWVKYLSRSGIAGHMGHMFRVGRSLLESFPQWLYHCTLLLAGCMNVQVSPRPHQYLVIPINLNSQYWWMLYSDT